MLKITAVNWKPCMLVLSFITILFFTLTSEAGTIKGVVTARRLHNKSDIVVCLKPEKIFKAVLPPINPIMDQRKLEFIPHVLAIPLGATVDFLNNDKAKHNIFSPDSIADKFNFGYYDSGEKRSHTFTKLGSAVLLCNKHDEMEAYVYVCDSQYIGITDKKGKYIIKNVPAGKYTAKVWHKKLRSHSQNFNLKDDEINLDIKLSR